MATIKKQGKGYKITVSCGYTADGRQVRKHITWVPTPGTSEHRAGKEAARQAALFEEKIRSNTFLDNRIKFSVFAAKYMDVFGALSLKPKTFQSYTENLVKINAALGHIKLCDLKPTHLNAFYKNLQEEGVRESSLAVCKMDLYAYLAERQLSLSKFAVLSGVSRATVKAAAEKQNIARASAEKIAAAMGQKVAGVFSLMKNMEPLAPATVLLTTAH